MEKGLKELGWSDRDLHGRGEGVEEEQVLAWWPRKETVVSREWISERLRMGDVSRVSKAMRIVNIAQNTQVRNLKRRPETFPKFTD